MFILNEKPLALDIAFEHEGIQYPANWLRLASNEERAALGITEVVEQPRLDDRYYWVQDNGNGTFTSTAKDLESIRSMRLAEIQTTAYSLLAPTDYKYVRSVETGEPVDDATKAHRTAIRTAYTANETAINACTTVEALAALTFTWPEAI